MSKNLPARRPRGITIVPFIGDLVAMARLLRDRSAPLWAKLLVVATVVYVVFPADAVPDVAPFFGWLDDVGLVLAVRLLLASRLEPYRYPLGAPPAKATVLAG